MKSSPPIFFYFPPIPPPKKSGEAFWKPELSLADLLSETKEKVRKAARTRSYHGRYDTYLITPAQRSDMAREGEGRSRTAIDERALMVMSNLVKHEVVVGITERLSDSMELLRRLIDNDGDVADLFVRYGLRDGGERDGAGYEQGDGMKINPSKISSSTVMLELRKDERFMRDLLEVVKYEQQVSDFAMALHLRQHASLRRKD